jgi:hypothetical protein
MSIPACFSEEAKRDAALTAEGRRQSEDASLTSNAGARPKLFDRPVQVIRWCLS